MSCYHPLKRFVVGEDSLNFDRDIVRFRPAFIEEDGHLAEVTHLCYQHGEFFDWTNPYPPPPDVLAWTGSMIRCGKCMGCRIDKSKEWANRCLLELQDHQEAYFLTLTYSDDYVPVSYFADPSSGEAQPSLTLRKRDFQLFMKRLRKRVAPDRIRFFGAGEYGDTTLRPHYHIIVFGLRIPDLVPYGKNFRGEMTYTSDFIHSVWSERKAPTRHGSVTPLTADKDYFCTPLGRVVIAPVTWETCAYVARYTTKKLYSNEAKFYEEFNIEPPFLLMSRHPGIGMHYYDEHPEMFDNEFLSISTDKGGRKFRPPYAFEKRLALDMDEDAYAVRKFDRHQMMLAARQAQLRQTNLSYGDLLQVQENNFNRRIKSLKRSL